MSRGFEAITSVVIDAPRAKVRDALTNPAQVKEYLHGTDIERRPARRREYEPEKVPREGRLPVALNAM